MRPTSELSRIAYRVNGYKGTIRFAIAGLSNTPSCVYGITQEQLQLVLQELQFLEELIDRDYKLYKERVLKEREQWRNYEW